VHAIGEKFIVLDLAAGGEGQDGDGFFEIGRKGVRKGVSLDSNCKCNSMRQYDDPDSDHCHGQEGQYQGQPPEAGDCRQSK
jgi:hypothetical protein